MLMLIPSFILLRRRDIVYCYFFHSSFPGLSVSFKYNRYVFAAHQPSGAPLALASILWVCETVCRVSVSRINLLLYEPQYSDKQISYILFKIYQLKSAFRKQPE